MAWDTGIGCGDVKALAAVDMVWFSFPLDFGQFAQLNAIRSHVFVVGILLLSVTQLRRQIQELLDKPRRTKKRAHVDI